MAPVRILLVDDFEPWRRFVCSMVATKPELQVICEVSDGLEAVQKAEELQPDLILLDIGLPSLNGIEAARRIRRLAPQSKILFMSQESSADVVQEALGLGAMGYVFKTHAGRELLPAVVAVLRGERFVSKRPEVREFSVGLGVPGPDRHEIVICSDEAFLLDTFAGVVAAALNKGNAAIVLATAPHRDGLLQRLDKQGLDVDQAIQEGTYIAVDVAESLSAIMTGGLPDPVRFFGGIDGFIESAAKASKIKAPRVVVCGEGVAYLHAEGNVEAAIQLEQLCDELARTREVDVLCAYPLTSIHAVET